LHVLEQIGRPFEVIAIDDGSNDESPQILANLGQAEPRLRIVRLTRNFGQTPARYAGFANVRGQIVVTIDADLQNPPEEIPKLIAKLEDGYDVVQGWREQRQDSWFRRKASRFLNAFVSTLVGGKIRDLGCGLKAYRREVIDRMVTFSHHARYIPAEVVWLGVNMAEVQVEHQERHAGQSKYGLLKLLRLNFDMISSISSAPIKLVGVIGWFFAMVGFLLSIRIIVVRIVYGDINQLGTVMAILFVLTGVQLIATGIMCEYIGRIFVEVQNKPYYVIKEILEQRQVCQEKSETY